MNTISFKATFEGMNNKHVLETLFERRTKDDPKHKIVFTKNPDEYGEDMFELFKDGVKTVEYKTEINERIFSMERLTGIYNILKIKEAQSIIEEKRNKK